MSRLNCLENPGGVSPKSICSRFERKLLFLGVKNHYEIRLNGSNDAYTGSLKLTPLTIYPLIIFKIDWN